ncbi:MAG: hypothetical protein HUK40_14130 [Desulfobacter sp.]|nr:hypothetical protein [Desulfobacter sp.]WDP87725.1 MAG: hypothetical protein HUN05_23460 [Desulfobacter sp.]
MKDQGTSKEELLEEWDFVKQDARAYLDAAPLLPELFNMDKNTLGPVYKKAFDAFSLENYQEAEDLFTSLFIFDIKDECFQTGLGATFEAQEKFIQAISIYKLAAAKKASPQLYYRMGKCFFGMGDKGRAIFMFEMAVEFNLRTKEMDIHQMAYVERSKKMLELLNS